MTSRLSGYCLYTHNEPVFLTKNGVGSLVVMSMEAYEENCYKSEVYDKLREAEIQNASTEERLDHDTVMSDLCVKLGCVDENLKRDFDSFCSEVGMSMTTAFCMFAKATLRENKIPFEICAGDPIYRKGNIERLTKAVAELDAGKGIAHDLIEDSDQ